MLRKYRKTEIIQAEQFDGSLNQIAKYKVHIVGPTTFDDKTFFLLPTKEGNMSIDVGDWIATGVEGEHWVIANDIFHKSYERCD